MEIHKTDAKMEAKADMLHLFALPQKNYNLISKQITQRTVRK